MRHAILLLSLAMIFLAIAPSPAETCSCAPVKPPSEAASEAGLVFSGKVTAIVLDDAANELGRRDIKFDVQEVFRGPKSAEIELRSRGGGSAACDFSFRIGQEYLVYAYRRDDDGPWMTSTCSRTRRLREAADDLRHLRGRG